MEEEAMTILFVFNGPFNFRSPTEWSVDTILGTSYRKRPVAGEDEDEENTVNGNGGSSRRGKKSRRSIE